VDLELGRPEDGDPDRRGASRRHGSSCAREERVAPRFAAASDIDGDGHAEIVLRYDALAPGRSSAFDVLGWR
jgi:hypothetical protein